ncbi:MAG: hypothetical protein ACLT76_02860 [Clostridium fessum]
MTPKLPLRSSTSLALPAENRGMMNGDRAGPDEEPRGSRDVAFCAPQGLSGDVEDLAKRPRSKSRTTTLMGDTDQDAHQMVAPAAAQSIYQQFFSADMLSGEAGT